MTVEMALALTTALGVAVVSANFAMSFVRKRLDADVRRMEAAALALREHEQAVQTILKSDAISDALREFVIKFSCCVPHKESADGLAATMGDLPAAGGDDIFGAELKALSKNHPEVVLAVGEMLRLGIAAMVLQWRDVSKRIGLVEILGSDVRTSRAAVQVVRSARKPDRNEPIATPVGQAA